MKIRKAYTITKSRECWTDEEHDKFLEALHLFDRDWKKIEAFVGSKTVIQIRSHAQKYFLKVQKSGKGEHVPPPRPKRKAAHPYPLKASKIAAMVPQISQPSQSSGSVVDPGYSMLMPGSNSMTQGGCSNSSIENTQIGSPSSESYNQQKVKSLGSEMVLPDFAQVYRFMGSIFDPNASDHLQKLKSMNPINVETVSLLMKNLAANLMSPEFEKRQKEILCSYDGADNTKPCGFNYTSKQMNAIPSV